ncbi:hypothetical protein LG302_08190 [Halomonas organivorans]
MYQDDNPLTFHVIAAAAQSVSPELRRAHAVSVAVELIAIKLRASSDGNLDSELDKLDDYSDRIQAALRHSRPLVRDRNNNEQDEGE